MASITSIGLHTTVGEATAILAPLVRDNVAKTVIAGINLGLKVPAIARLLCGRRPHFNLTHNPSMGVPID